MSEQELLRTALVLPPRARGGRMRAVRSSSCSVICRSGPRRR